MKINFKLKYGQIGLFMDFYHKDKKLGRILISKDYDKIYEFLGLSYDRWREGFDELEDIFSFISESKYFNWEYLQLENNNRVNRERDAKRKSYMSFLEYIDKNCKDDNHRYPYEKDKSVYLKQVADFFLEANIELEIRRMEYEYCKNLYIKSKFNGGELMRRFGLQGKEISEAIGSFKKAIESIPLMDDSFEDYVLETPMEDIYTDFKAFLQ